MIDFAIHRCRANDDYEPSQDDALLSHAEFQAVLGALVILAIAFAFA